MLPSSEHQTLPINDEDDDGGPIDERVMADVNLAWKKGASSVFKIISTFITCFKSCHIPCHCPQ